MRSLAGKKARQETSLTLVEGPSAVYEALRAKVEIEILIQSESLGKRPGAENLTGLLDTYPYVKKSHLVSDDLFLRMSESKSPQGVLCVVRTPFLFKEGEPEGSWDQPLYVLGADIQDPGNVGTLIRSVAAAGGEVVFSGKSADPFSPKAIRASAGAVFKTKVTKESDVIGQAKKWLSSNVTLYATSPRGTLAPWEASFCGPTALIFGNEASGLPKDIFDLTESSLGVPMPGGTESLNVACAACMMLYEVVRQRRVCASHPG